jgi:hypothetical protein
MDNTRKELWDELDGETERAYRAFETYRNLPSGERTLIEAYRQHVVNPGAAKPSDTWARWSHDYAWSERAAAYDAHRERAIEKAIVEEAHKQARQVEQSRYRYNDLMTLMHERMFS